MITLYAWLIFMVGIAIGSIVTNIIFGRQKAYGTLVIDHTNPKKDNYTFKVDDLDMLDSKKSILLKIETHK